MKCPNCGAELPSLTFIKAITKSGNSLGITLVEEVVEALNLKHGDKVQVTITKLSIEGR